MKYFLVCLFMMPVNAGAKIFAAAGYLSELKKVEDGKGRRSMEALYARGQELCDELAGSLDSMNERELARSSAALRGIEIWKDEFYSARLKPEFFLALAGKKGKKADREFFSILKDEKTQGGWDVYISSLPDLGGCSALGSGAFVKFYGRWSAFREKYPGDYADPAQEAMQNIEDALCRATCVCGGREKALEELGIFMNNFPEIPAMEDLAERAVQFRKSAPGVRFNCKAN